MRPTVCRRGWWRRWRSFAEVLPGEVDEDGLERGLGDRQVGDGEAGPLGALDDRWKPAVVALHREQHLPAHDGGVAGVGDPVAQHRSQLLEVTALGGYLHGGVGADRV